ncbi:class F sortase [Streptomyces uncialis]|uniref:class F sortase n=1 Tax=Streptomyces uncialis TaxID=1048205 RepID=UPI0033F881F5
MFGRAHRVRRAGALALLAVTLTGALTACGGGSTGDEVTRSAPTASAGSTPGTDSGPSGTPSPGRAARGDGIPAPTDVTIPSIGVSSTLMSLGLNKDGTVEVPPADQGMTAGWYTGRPAPGQPGPAVIIGHNSTRHGPAVFEKLHELRKGARIDVRDASGGTSRFAVTGTETVSKKAFPTERVYGATSERVLRLITCDGEFDAEGHPVDNLIVYAELRP